MKKADIRSFVLGYLTLRGAEVIESNGDLLRVHVPEADTLGREHLLAFGARAHRAHPGSELVAVGSAFLDQLIQEATQTGRYTVVHESSPTKVRRVRSLRPLPTVAGYDWGHARAASRPLFLFVYVSEYHMIDVADDLILIGYDPLRREALASPQELLGEIRAGRVEPDPQWPALPPVPTAGDVLRSLDALDRRLQRRARRVKEASAIEIARETANIEAYYRQLVAEARSPVGRGQLSAEEESERVRVLQLDWKRRVQEVSRFWEARGDVRLSALGAIMRPCWVIPLEKSGKKRASRKTKAPYAIADCNTGSVAEPRCPLCGAKLGKEADIWGSDLVCPRHVRDADAAADGEPGR